MKRWDILGNLIQEYEFSTYVEVGVKAGRTCHELLKRFPDLVIYAVDPWTLTPYYKQWKRMDIARSEMRFDRLVTKADGRLHKMKMLSVEAALNFADHSVDIVFIDGDHSYAGVLDDIAAWMPKLRFGGVMAGHDIDNDSHKGFDFSGVRQAVEEVFDNNFFTGDDHTWWIRL